MQENNIYRIEVFPKKFNYDKEYSFSIKELGIDKECEVFISKLYWIKGEYAEKQIKEIVKTCLVEEVVENYTLNEPLKLPAKSFEISYRFGVNDPVEESVKEAIKLIGYKEPEFVKTGKRVFIKGNLTCKEIEFVAKKLFYNPVIEEKTEHYTPSFKQLFPYKFKKIEIPFLQMDEKEMLTLSRERSLALNIEELNKIKAYFQKLGRNPTDCEIETIAQTWSEHCVHKTFKSKIVYGEEIIEGLLASIMKVSNESKKNWCVVLFKDNAGIIELDENYNIAVKVETHNHPCAIEPYGGASTGIGGVIRDILGAGLCALPFLNIDVFCVGPLNLSHKELPRGVLHPKRILKGVISGVRDYGNRMGIPTSAGAVYIDDTYLTNPLVFCGTAGVLPKEKSFKEIKPGYKLCVIGGKTGKDGIHGVTFASLDLKESSETTHISAVQIGDPITEKKVLDALIHAQKENLFEFVTDVGGGGLSSAIGESAQDTGVDVYLENIPLKYEGMSYTEIWISESQERMVVALKKENVERFLEICEKYGCSAAVIGEYTDSKKLRLFYRGNLVCDIDMDFLHKGRPEIKRVIKPVQRKEEDIDLPEPPLERKEEILLRMLSSFNIKSRESIIRQYDHEVQGGSVVKSLLGIESFSPQDAVVYKPPVQTSKRVAFACGLKPSYARISPYWSAASAVDEAVRSLICAGVPLDRIALLDNFCFGNPEDDSTLCSIVETVKGACSIALAYKTPFISGKDSLYNEFQSGKFKSKILPTVLITGIGVIDENISIPNSCFKKQENPIYLLGETYKELGGSEYINVFYPELKKKGIVPKVNPSRTLPLYNALHNAIKKGTVLSSHDLSEGGLGVALAECTFALKKGAEIEISNVLSPHPLKWYEILFSESNGRILVEVQKEKEKEFLKIMQALPVKKIGYVTERPFLKIEYNGNILIESEIKKMYKAFSEPLL